MAVSTRKIPDDLLWAFAREKYADAESFHAALIKYNVEILGNCEPIEDHPISDSNSVRLLFLGYTEGGDELEDLAIIIRSDRQKQLTFLEFMFLANNALYQYLCESDHIYYEGIIPKGESEGVMTYELLQGS